MEEETRGVKEVAEGKAQAAYERKRTHINTQEKVHRHRSTSLKTVRP